MKLSFFPMDIWVAVSSVASAGATCGVASSDSTSFSEVVTGVFSLPRGERKQIFCPLAVSTQYTHTHARTHKRTHTTTVRKSAPLGLNLWLGADIWMMLMMLCTCVCVREKKKPRTTSPQHPHPTLELHTHTRTRFSTTNFARSLSLFLVKARSSRTTNLQTTGGTHCAQPKSHEKPTNQQLNLRFGRNIRHCDKIGFVCTT